MLRWEFEPRCWWIFLISAVKKDTPPTTPFMLFQWVHLPQYADSFNKECYISLSQTFHITISFKHRNVNTDFLPTKYLLLLFSMFVLVTHRHESSDSKHHISQSKVQQDFATEESVFSWNRPDAKTSGLIFSKTPGRTDITLIMFLLPANCCCIWIYE